MRRFTYDHSPLAEIPILAVPGGLRDAQALFAAYAPVLPGWFGQNFDAFNDVIAGLDALRVVHVDVPLQGAERQIYLEILEESAVIAIFPAACQPAVEAALAELDAES